MEPVDLNVATAAEIGEWLRTQFSEMPQYFECAFPGEMWLEALHVVPQTYVHVLRRAETYKNFDDKFLNLITTLCQPLSGVSKGQILKMRTPLRNTGTI